MKIAVLILVLGLLLCGCSSVLDGAYYWEASHPVEASPAVGQDVNAATYSQLRAALVRFVAAGTTQGTIFVADYDWKLLEVDIRRAVQEVERTDPIAAYAVEEITCDLGTSGSKRALSVTISYAHDRTEIRKIKRADDNIQAREIIAAALIACDTGVVMLVEDYEETDFVQMVEDYTLRNPHHVMELPQVNVNIYPETGKTRVVEMKFSYQTSRETLKKMQTEVQRIFSASTMFVSGDGSDNEKLSQLYGLLMNRFEYKLETSITPSYHLLCNGGGDSRAFASVYGAMCRQAGLECMMVSGTRNGEPWYWNIVSDDGVYYHVDLLACKELEDYQQWADAHMEGYVWDISAYPTCGPEEEPPLEE